MFAALQPVFYCFKHLKIYLLSIFYEEMVRLETTIIHWFICIILLGLIP